MKQVSFSGNKTNNKKMTNYRKSERLNKLISLNTKQKFSNKINFKMY